ncbi:MAG: hypothetical protein ACE5PV_15655, partial [Candidatus Poribacteria bacterium]
MKQHESEPTNKAELLTQIRASIDEMGFQNDYCKMNRELEKQMLYLKVRDILSAQLHSTLNVEDIYENMRELAVNLLGVEIFQIFFYDGAERFHYLGIANGVSDGAIKTVLSQNRDELIADVMKSPTPSPIINAGLCTRLNPSLLNPPVAYVPMIADGQVKGVMTVEKLINQKSNIDMEYAELLKLLLKEATLALTNGYAYRRMENAAMTDGLTGLYNHRY